MAEALSPKYHVVVANPPYMGEQGNMNSALVRDHSKYPIEIKLQLYSS